MKRNEKMQPDSLAYKLECFIRNALVATRSIRDDELRGLGISGDPRKVSNLFFELGVAFQSQAINTIRSRVFFGAHSYMNPGGYVRAGVFVGRYCSIGRRVSIGAGMHSMTGISTSPKLHGRGGKSYSHSQCVEAELVQSRKLKSEDRLTIIENDVWVGDGAVIVPGVRVATGAVIGANAVVTRDVDPYTVVAGIPAKPLRRRFSVAVIDELLQTSYWDYSTELLQSLPCSNVFDFVAAFHAKKQSKECLDTLERADAGS